MELPYVLALLGNLGTGEILFILLIVLLLFGAAKIPELARSLGKAQREFVNARDKMEQQVAIPAAPVVPPMPRTESEEHKVRAEAEELGIDTKGKSIDELREAITLALKHGAPKE